MKRIFKLSSCTVQLLALILIFLMLRQPATLHAAPDAARVAGGDLKVDGIHFSVDGSVIRKLTDLSSPWTIATPNIYFLGGNVGIGTQTPNEALSIAGNAMIELGAGVPGKDFHSGKIAYQRFTDALDIIGAGSLVSNRKIHFHSQGGATFDGPATFAGTVNATQISNSGNITLPESTSTSVGNIMKGTTPFIHNFGSGNTFLGENAGNFTMISNINSNPVTGSYNTAIGGGTLYNNSTGAFNTATGLYALTSNTSGSFNTAIGQGALQLNQSGNNNTAIGQGALVVNTASNNTAIGQGALQNNTYHNNNTAIGYGALRNLNGSFTNDDNIAVGASAGSSVIDGSNNIYIGNVGINFDNNTTRIGNNQTRAFISGIWNRSTGATDAIPVLIDSNGQLGTVKSSRRYKDDIADMAETSSQLMKLRPVTFHYKSDQNPAGRSLQYGLIAEEVAEVIPELVAHSADGSIETVFYQFLAPMLLNEYQKQQRTIEVQNTQITALEMDRIQLLSRIEALEKQAAKIASLEEHSARMARLLTRLENPDVLVGLRR